MRHRRAAVAVATLSCLGFVCAPAASASPVDAPLPTVLASYETPPSFDDADGGDSDVDDPAIWRNPRDPKASLVIVTLKNGGLAVYDLEARELQRIETPPAPRDGDAEGRFNNVDLLPGIRLGGRTTDLAVVSDRGRDQIRFYAIRPGAPGGPLVDVTAADVPLVFNATQDEVNEQATVYGLDSAWVDGIPTVFTSRRSRTDVAALTVRVRRDGTVTYRESRRWTLPSAFPLPGGGSWTPCQDNDTDLPQVEGMVYDEDNGILYAGQEQVGIWRLPVVKRRDPSLVDRTREFGVPYERTFDPEEEEYACDLLPDQDPGVGGTVLSADVEGLTIAETKRGRGYLLASSQGDDTFAIYDRTGRNRYLGGFVVGDGPAIDGTQESDGADVYVGRLPGFPRGLLVVQDGDNTPEVLDGDGEARANTNVKFVDWGAVLDTIED